ncbi:polycystin-1-like protein 1 isoform X3 [Physella acuta]|uniref:polycystin-1-like protein 1 isoform X3 n=1 Tax=Physella acuta TaxID=109671 RepID=UPI0027DD0130|nr:polycystin-1-like protein 1 isoform X3 [Physella acuta]
MIGWQRVKVTAGNCKGEVESEPVKMLVVAPIRGLSINILKDTLVGSTVLFSAVSLQGNLANYTWDFGDGHFLNHSNNDTAAHDYQQVGEYMVRLYATNPVGSSEAAKRIFVLPEYCKPPQITILGYQPQTDYIQLEFLQSELIRVEANIKINCSVTSRVRFRWEVKAATNHVPVNLYLPRMVERRAYRHVKSPALILPPWTLDEGKYIFQLKVEMNGTIIPVYSESEVNVTIKSTPLVSHIHGGIYRHIKQNSTVILDGRKSVNADDSSVKLGFMWGCHPLKAKSESCFYNSSLVPERNTSVLMFPASWLNSNYTQFVFNLTVFKPTPLAAAANKTEEIAVADQVIKVLPDPNVLEVLLECPQCYKNRVNSDRKISFRTHCVSCPEGPLQYKWEIFRISNSLVQDSQSLCTFLSDDSALHSLNHGDDSEDKTSINALSRDQLATTIGRVPKVENTPIMIIDKPDAQTGELRNEDDQDKQMPSVFEGFLSISEGQMGESRRPKASNNRVRVEFPSVDEGINPPRARPAQQPTSTATPEGCVAPDCHIREIPLSTETPHIVSIKKDAIYLRPESTLTGLDQPSLVLKPGTLRPGISYIIEVVVTSKDGSSGLAMILVEVNRSPMKGRCSLRSQKAALSVFCTDWKDEHLPLLYEVSYSLNGSSQDGQLGIVYQGPRHNIVVKPPVGLTPSSYPVQLHVAVLNRLGARTLICSTSILTEGPRHNTTGDKTLETFLNESITLHRLAASSVYEDSSYDLLESLTQLALQLNAHAPLEDTQASPLQAGEDIRSNIIESLSYIPLRHEVEIINALKCLIEATHLPHQLNAKSVLIASILLKDINVETEVLMAVNNVSGYTRGLHPEILNLGMKLVSNILTAVSSNHTLFVQNKIHIYKSIITDTLDVLNNFIQLELQYHSIGEKSLFLKDKFLSLNASHYTLGEPTPLEMNGVVFRLPSSLGVFLSKSSAEDTVAANISGAVVSRSLTGSDYLHNGLCFQARTMSFSINPFAVLSNKTDMIQSELATLDIYNCFGDGLVHVQELPADDMIHIIIPRKPSVITNTSTQHYLDKATMNIHQVNASLPKYYYDISGEDGLGVPANYLHVHIQLEPVAEGRSFPIMVIISSLSPPHNLKNYVFKKQYEPDTQEIKIFLSHGPYDGSQHYYISLVEASFNSGRRRSNEVKGRLYTLSTWLGTCVYWKHASNKWSSSGCQVLPSSSVEALHCRCNHLTTFGGYFELIPNDLSFISVEEFFSPHENPVVIILLGVLLAVYLSLAVVLRPADVHDAKKGTCVFLRDNSLSHQQKYEVIMETGFSHGAGTTSKISIILHGEEGMSETRELISEDNRPMFERNSRDRFIVTLPSSLGRIYKIQLWHNNTGSSPGWYLRQVVVRDLSAGQVYYFLCQRWLAVDRDDGNVEREFTVIDGSNISFSMIFWWKSSQYLSDFHTWISLWTCPPHSRFTRVQRLSVCLTLLLSYMCLSAIWFSQVPPKIRGEFGLLDLSWQNILVGCGCCAMIIPLNIFLSFLFRRSRVHYPGHQQDKAIVAGKSVSDFVSDGEEESAPQSAVTYSILDQSILNWQNIQEWAQKQWLKRQQSVRSSANSVKTTQTSPQLSGPLAAPLVQQTLLADDTDQASSGFEDATSQATAERHRVKATSDISSDGKKSRNVEHCDVGVLATSWRFFLPFWCRYIAWTLCFCLSCACAAITIMYGFRFGYTKSVMWLQSVYFSLMMCIFIAQPLLIFLVVLYTALCQRNNASVFDHYEDGFYGERVICRDYIQPYSHLTEEEEELQRGVAERSRSRYLRFAGPPQEKQLRSSRKKLIKQRRAMLLLMDFCFFVFMFILLSIMAFGKNTTAHYQLNKSLKDAFLVKQSENSTSFLKVRSASGWYRWSQTVLIDTLYSHTSWSNQSLHPGETLGLVIGNVQLRQLTFAPKTCQSLHYLAPNFDCFHMTDNSSGTNSSDSFRQQHQATDNHFSRGFWGQNYWLDTSGYILQLNHSRDEAIKQLIGLETEDWINRQTKAVIVEMTLYNAATNLFSSLTLLYEVEASGHVSTASYIMSTYLFRYITIWDNCILGCELFCIVITLLMCYNQLQHIIMLGKSYFYHFWNYIELLMCTSFLLYTGCYIYRCILVSEAVEFIRSTFYEQFIPLGFVALWDQILQGLVSVMLFCVMLKLLQVLRYHQIFWRLQSVYRRCKQELLLAGSLYIGFILAFSSLSTGLFGAVQFSMRSLWSSVMAMTALSVRRFHWSDNQVLSQEQNPWLDIVLMFSFTFCHGFIMTYIFSVLAYRFKKTKNCHVLAMPASQLLSFYWDKMVKWSGSRPEACHEEIDNSLPPEFTMAEILYLVEELLFRMNALLGTSGLPDKRNSLTDSDSTQNYGDDGISSGGSDVSLPKDQMIPITMSVALEGARLEHRVQKIEDKLCSNEPYLAQLLKLDSIGTDILSEEKEKEIRSHLEFEIFRQLQMQRQEAAVCEQQELPVFDASSKLAAGQAKYSSPDSTGPEPIRQHIPHCSPFMVLDDSTEMQKKGQVHKENSSTCSDLDPDEAEETGGAAQFKPLMTLPPKRSQSLKVPGRQAGRYDLSPALTCQKQWLDLSTGDVARDAKLTARYLRVASTGGVASTGRVTSTGSVTSASGMTCAGFVHKQEVLEHPPDKKDIQSSSQDKRAKAEHKQDKLASKHKPEAPHQNLTAGGPKTSSGNVSPQSSEGERGHKRTDSSSGQSERMDTPRLVSKKPELPPKPTFAHSMLRPMEAGKALSGWSCKPKQFNPELMSPMCAESSSGSEQEASSKRLSQGRRNLRKTKSRGKGKGNEACMSSPMVLEADFTSSGQSSNCNILIHPVPSGINLDDSTMPEQFLN